MQYKISYDIDFSELIDFIEALKIKFNKNNSNLIEAVKTAGQYAVQEWIRTANGKFTHSEGGYVQGILEGVEYPYKGNPLAVNIENKTPYAIYLERGVEPFDLKKMLTTSNKVRVSKTGERYLVIPFRHGTPDSNFRSVMPNDIYKQAKELKGSYIARTYREGITQRGTQLENPIPRSKAMSYVIEADFLRVNNPNKVKRSQYVWGEKLTNVGGRFEGMYRLEKNVNVARQDITTNTPLGKFTFSKMVNQTSHNFMYSNYITFRVMKETSEGWQHSGIKAMNILKETIERIETPIMNMLKEGVKKDLEAIGVL